MSIAVYFARLENLLRRRVGEGDASTISTAEIASELNTTLEGAVSIYEAYNRHPSRIFEFEKRSAPFENPSYHRLVIHKSAVSTRQPFSRDERGSA